MKRKTTKREAAPVVVDAPAQKTKAVAVVVETPAAPVQHREGGFTYRDLEAMAETMAASGLFGVKSKVQALALMLVAQSEGRHPASAARDYHIIEGKPSLTKDAMLARFQQAGGCIEWHERTNDKASATFSHPQGGKCKIEWTMAQAKAAGIAGKKNWLTYPRQMLSARVISEGVRAVFPAVLDGMYTPEEVADFDAPRNVTPEPAMPTEHEINAPVRTAEAAIDYDVCNFQNSKDYGKRWDSMTPDRLVNWLDFFDTKYKGAGRDQYTAAIENLIPEDGTPEPENV